MFFLGKPSRRDFFKLLGGGASAVSLSLMGNLSLSRKALAADNRQMFQGSTATFQRPLKSVNVYSEDGKLREVIFGRIDSFRLPKYDPIFDFAGEKMVSLLKSHGGELFKDAAPDWFAKVDKQAKTVIDFLESKGIVVHRPADLTPNMEANYSLMSTLNMDNYSRDGLVSVGNSMFEGAFMTPERSRNKHTFRGLSMVLLNNGTTILSAPQPLDTYDHDMTLEPLIEGGDVLIDHGHIYVGNSGVASNRLGINWLRNAYPDWQVHEIKIKTDKFPHQHLDCVLVAFSDWGVICESEVEGGIAGLPEPLRNKQWISLELDEAKDKLGNFIAISPSEIVMASEAKRLRDAIQKARPELTIYHFPYYEVGKIGGSLRCNTQPIFREG